jgi:hypothetical protein
MDIICYTGSLIVVALGIFLGVLLGYAAKEELKPGRKYLAMLQFAILCLMVFYSLYLWLSPYVPIMLFFILLVWLDTKKLEKEPKEKMYYVIYAVFAFAFFEASKSCSFIVFDSLIFLFGLPTGSLLFMKKKNWLKHSASLSIMLVAVSLLLFILLRTLMLP